jgi:TonB family protein
MDAAIRSRSAIITVLIHVAIFLVLFFTLMTISIPPFPETGGGGGVLVNIGMLEEASGTVQPMSEVITKEPLAEKVRPVSAQEDPVATQDFEESAVVNEVKEKKKNTPVKPDPKINQPKKVTEPVKTVNTNAIYKGKTNDSRSQGTGAGKGDQGDPSGDPFSKYTGKSGSGKGGDGTGTGEGSGNGPGKGGGVSFSLAGRKMLRTPEINDKSQETGKVVVDITVDKDGNVTSAIPGGRNSTTTSSYLLKLAKDAALKAKFTPSPSDADIQKGTITFVFLVQ